MAQAEAKIESAGSAKGVAIKIIAAWVLLPLFFLATGGSLAWWEAWVYCLVLLGPMTAFLVYMARNDPDFIARRTKLHEKEQAQRRILAWGYPSLIAALVVPGLDHRFGWSEPPTVAVVAAMAIVLGGYLTVAGSSSRTAGPVGPSRSSRSSRSFRPAPMRSSDTRCTRAPSPCTSRHRSRSDRGGP